MNAISQTYVLSPLEEALRLASQGLKVIPLHSPTKGGCTCGKDCGKSAGKHPIWPQWAQRATDDPDEIRKIWQQYPMANLGVPMGNVNGVFALDVDGKEGMETLKKWMAEGWELPATWQVLTGGGGMHLWYRIPPGVEIPNSVKKIGVNIDIRGNGGQSVAPGSLHKNGNRYRWAPGRSPADLELADPPKWLLDRIEELAQNQERNFTPDSNSVRVDFHLDDDRIKHIMGKAVELTNRSQHFKEVTMGEITFPSPSERDLSIANVAAINGWTDQEITDFLIHYRRINQEDLKHPLYYQLTIAKARQWAEEQQAKRVEVADPAPLEPEPIPIPKREPVAPFPVEVYPRPVRRFVEETCRSMGLPADFVGVHILTFLGAAIGSTREIELKPGYRQRANLYTALVADTGSGKSPSLEKAFYPILKMQRQLHKLYQDQMEIYEEEMRLYESQLQDWKKKKTGEEPPEPVPPKLEELYTTHATVEAVIKVLKDNRRGIVIKADELSGWIRSMNQYKGGRGDDREHYLSLWSGSDIKVNRVRNDNGDPVFIPNPFCAVTGNIPPDILPTLEDEHGNEDGFIHRVLMAYPDNQDPPEWTWEGVSEEAVRGYMNVIEELYNLKPLGPWDDPEPKILRLDEEAKIWWTDWHRRHNAEMKDPDFPKRLRGPWAKMTNQLARIALIMQMTRFVCGESGEEFVDSISLSRAIQLVDYFKSHARKIYQQLKKTQEDKWVEEAIDWIRRRGGTVRKRDIIAYQVAGIRKASEAERLFQTLEDFGYGKVQVVKPARGRPTVEFVLFHAQ